MIIIFQAVIKTYYDGPLAVNTSVGSGGGGGGGTASPSRIPPAYQPPPSARPYSPPHRGHQLSYHTQLNSELIYSNNLKKTRIARNENLNIKTI